MSAEPTTNGCPSCGGDRISIVNAGQIYCVDCNRKYFVFPTHVNEANSATSADQTPLPKAA